MLKYIFFIAGFLLECTAAAFCFYSEWILCFVSIVIGFILMQPVVCYFSDKSMKEKSNEEDTSIEQSLT